MKRIALVVVVLVLVVAVALPPLFGARARSLIDTRLDSIGEGLAPYASVEMTVDDWDVGWSSSTATVSIDVVFTDRAEWPFAGVDLPRLDTAVPELVTLHHGPIVIGPETGLGWGGIEFAIDAVMVPRLRGFLDATGVEHVARVGILVGFFGGTALDLEVPAFAYEARDNQIDFQGLEANASVGGDGEIMELSGELNGLGVKGASSQVAVDRVSGATRVDKAGRDPRIPDLLLGGGWIEIAGVGVSGEAADVAVRDLRWQGDTRIEEDVFVMTNRYQAGQVNAMSLELDELVLELVMRFGVDGLARLMETGYDVNTLDAGALDPLKQLEMVKVVLEDRFTIDIENLGFKHEGRTAAASLSFEFRGDDLPDGFEFDPADYAALLPLIAVNFDLAFHRDLWIGLRVDRMDALVRVLAREGILRETGDDYTLNVGFDNGAITVNGEPFEPFDLVGLLSGI